MAKNKLRGQKSRNVFHIASQKSFKVKNKAKPVTTNLKKINIMNAEKVNRVNKAFIDIQKELANFSKGLSLEPPQKQLGASVTNNGSLCRHLEPLSEIWWLYHQKHQVPAANL
uniref:Ribosomal biogenesis factor n=1 Tax=Ovis aries TaxID=9940 RepID=A0AC11CSE3_SHEEP